MFAVVRDLLTHISIESSWKDKFIIFSANPPARDLKKVLAIYTNWWELFYFCYKWGCNSTTVKLVCTTSMDGDRIPSSFTSLTLFAAMGTIFSIAIYFWQPLENTIAKIMAIHCPHAVDGCHLSQFSKLTVTKIKKYFHVDPFSKNTSQIPPINSNHQSTWQQKVSLLRCDPMARQMCDRWLDPSEVHTEEFILNLCSVIDQS